MTNDAASAGSFNPAGTDLHLNRIGYGAMQLAGPHVWGPPRDEAAALAVLKEAVALGINHIDTADFYGPHVTNRLIRQALHPYPAGLTIVTKIGFFRGEDGSWLPDHSADALRRAVHDNLSHLGLEALDVVNLRLGGRTGPEEASLAEPFGALLDLQRQGLIRHLGISTVTRRQVAEARGLGPLACVQNEYNIAKRGDDAMIDELAEAGIAYVPYFPLGGFSPLQSAALDGVAAALGATPMQVALAWLLRRSPNILLIPGTSSVEHLRQNVAAATLDIPPDQVARLDAIGRPA